MFDIITGTIAFILYYIYDINSIFIHNRLLKSCFWAGSVLLFVSVAHLIAATLIKEGMDAVHLVWVIPLLFMLALEIYTLFFALPFEEAYKGDADGQYSCCKDGVYSLCRHPGVLWFAGFFICLCFMLPDQHVWCCAIIYVLMDFLYIILQDFVIFPRQFSDYDYYKKTTPFLIPALRIERGEKI